MKERPILFTPDNAQKCFEGTKTQTRQRLKIQPGKFTHIEFDKTKGWQYWWDVGSSGMPNVYQEYAQIKCPYGVVGDRLWVREAWAFPGEELHMYKGCHADAEIVEKWKKDKNAPQVKWTPAIHMPRWACRTVLEISEVRVERVQDISETDCCLEGCGSRITRDLKKPRFIALWESINGLKSWERNDWVWVLSFRRVEQ